MIDRSHKLSVSRQAKLLSISRGTVYYQPKPPTPEELALMHRIDRLHLEFPFAGSRMLRDLLRQEGHRIGRKRVSTLMNRMGIEALYRTPKTSQRHPDHRVYPYLLRGLTVDRPSQVWAMDITYIPMDRGFVYLVAVLDWHSRRVLSWKLSNTMDVHFCLEAVSEAVERYGPPEILNTDQGSQFTSQAFTGYLSDLGVKISLDGKGAWRDNVFVERLWRSVKYEEVVCYERERCWMRRERCFIEDEGRPLGVGFREQAPNRHKLRRSRADVVSVVGKGGGKLRQVGIEETNESEPLMTCRYVSTGVETGTLTSVPRYRLGVTRFTAQLAPGMKAA